MFAMETIPESVTTDAKGRFTLRGLGDGQEIDLLIDDDRFARQELIVRVGEKETSRSSHPGGPSCSRCSLSPRSAR